MIQDVLNAIKNTLQADPNLATVTNYHLVNGMIPGLNPTISIGCGKIKYNDYDRTQDEAIAPVQIWVYLQDMNAERGESSIRDLTENVRYSLLADIYFGGEVDASTVTDITFDSEQVNQSQILHYALIEMEVKYYEPRQRPATVPTAAEIDNTMNSETFILNT